MADFPDMEDVMQRFGWDDVEQRIRLDDEGKYDTTVPIQSMRFQEGELVLDQPTEMGYKHLSMTDHATQQFCSRFGIPVKYYRDVSKRNAKLSDSMLNDGVSHNMVDLALNSRKSKNMLVRCKGRVVRAGLSDKYSAFDNKHVAEICHGLTEGQFDHTIRSFSLSDSGFWMKITCDDLTVKDPSSEGNFLKIGFVIGNSEVGKRQLTSNPFIFRQACTNDAVTVAEKSVAQRHVHLDHETLRLMMTQSIAYAIRTGEEQLNKVLESREVLIKNPASVIKALCKKSQFSRKNQDSVLQAYQVEPEENAWAVVNAFTRAAQQIEDSDQRIEVESLAGNWMTQTDKFWDKMAIAA